MEAQDKVKELYLQYEVLSRTGEGTADEIQKKKTSYQTILLSSRGTDKEKTLVAQFIPRFFHLFPDVYDESLSAYLDLCEDPNICVRKEAIKGFPKFFQGRTNLYSKKFGDILSQMLATGDSTEAGLVRNSLTALLRTSPSETLRGIFQQVGRSGDEGVRGVILKFVGSRIRVWNTAAWDEAVLNILLEEVEKCLKDCLAEEIPSLVGLLLVSCLGKCTSGRGRVCELLLRRLQDETKTTVLPQDLRRFTILLRHATALISITPDLNSNELFTFLAKTLLLHYLQLPGASEGSGDCLRIIKHFAELAAYTKKLPNSTEIIDNLLNLLLHFLPCPTLQESVETLKKLQFLIVECLLSSLQHCLKSNPNYFSKKTETLRDLRYRLLYFAKVSNTYTQVIQDSLKNITNSNKTIKDDTFKTNIFVALKTLTNVSSLIKDLFHTPPCRVSAITLSWLDSDRKSGAELKRKYQEHNNLSSNSYKPPFGKYSHNLRS